MKKPVKKKFVAKAKSSKKPEAPEVMKKSPVSLAVVFDTETTGLVENRTLPLDRQPEVIEFYGATVDMADGRIVGEFHSLICPSRRPIPVKTTQITGIKDADLDGQPPFKEVSESIFELLEKAPLIIAHNLSFDKDMIEIEGQRLDRKVAWGPGHCTVEQTVHIKSHRLNMAALYQHLFDEAFVGAHRAKADVAALIRCVVELRRRELL